MSYKYSKGSLPDHMNPSLSDSKALSQHGLSTKSDATSVVNGQGNNPISDLAEMVQMANPADTYQGKAQNDHASRVALSTGPKKIGK